MNLPGWYGGDNMRVFIFPLLITFLAIGCANQSPELTRKNLQQSLCNPGRFSYKDGGRKCTPFRVIHISCGNPDYAKVKISVNALLAGGVDVNATSRRGGSALFYASSQNHGEVVKFLLDKGADPQRKDKMGWAALRIASRFNSAEIVRLIEATHVTE
jgi:hypothetical protein